jgi:hypothetical protein
LKWEADVSGEGREILSAVLINAIMDAVMDSLREEYLATILIESEGLVP